MMTWVSVYLVGFVITAVVSLLITDNKDDALQTALVVAVMWPLIALFLIVSLVILLICGVLDLI